MKIAIVYLYREPERFNFSNRIYATIGELIQLTARMSFFHDAHTITTR